MARRVLVVVGFVLFGAASLAIAQAGWILVTPPVDEARRDALPGDASFQSLSVKETRSAAENLVKKDAPLTQWELHAFDSARACEASRARNVQETRLSADGMALGLAQEEWARQRVAALGDKALDQVLEDDRARELISEGLTLERFSPRPQLDRAALEAQLQKRVADEIRTVQSRERAAAARERLLSRLTPAQRQEFQAFFDESDRQLKEVERHVFRLPIPFFISAEQARLSRCVPASALYPAPR